MRTTIVIPARLASARLPRKVLADIGGKPMLQHVYERAAACRSTRDIRIAADSEEVASAARAWGAHVHLTDPALPSGTARIASLASQIDADLIVNVQGDEPLLDPSVIDGLVTAYERAQPNPPEVVTPIFAIDDPAWLQDPSVVKVTLRHDGTALYFSRSAIPHVRDASPPEWLKRARFWGHVGVYAYRRDTLLQFGALPPSPLEESEKLEQLRFLQAGARILTAETTYRPLAVDVPEDLERVRRLVATQPRSGPHA